jgi:hypothetical protein
LPASGNGPLFMNVQESVELFEGLTPKEFIGYPGTN